VAIAQRFSVFILVLHQDTQLFSFILPFLYQQLTQRFGTYIAVMYIIPPGVSTPFLGYVLACHPAPPCLFGAAIVHSPQSSQPTNA
jgi:hypothetical protein